MVAEGFSKHRAQAPSSKWGPTSGDTWQLRNWDMSRNWIVFAIHEGSTTGRLGFLHSAWRQGALHSGGLTAVWEEKRRLPATSCIRSLPDGGHTASSWPAKCSNKHVLLLEINACLGWGKCTQDLHGMGKDLDCDHGNKQPGQHTHWYRATSPCCVPGITVNIPDGQSLVMGKQHSLGSQVKVAQAIKAGQITADVWQAEMMSTGFSELSYSQLYKRTTLFPKDLYSPNNTVKWEIWPCRSCLATFFLINEM